MALSDYLKNNKKGGAGYYNSKNGSIYGFATDDERADFYNPANGAKYSFAPSSEPAQAADQFDMSGGKAYKGLSSYLPDNNYGNDIRYDFYNPANNGSYSFGNTSKNAPVVSYNKATGGATYYDPKENSNPWNDAYKNVSEKNNRAMEYYRGAVNNAVNAQETRLNGQKRNIYEGYNENVKAMGREQDAAIRQLPENLSALGLYGQGVGETAVANIKNQYSQQIAQLMKQKNSSIYDIDNQIEAAKQQAAADIYNYNAQMMARDPELYLQILQQKTAQDNINREWQHGIDREAIADERYQEESDFQREQWEYQKAQDAIANDFQRLQWDYNVSQAEKSRAEEWLWRAVSLGAMPSDEELASAGLLSSKDMIKNMVQRVIYSDYERTSAGSGSGSGSSSGNFKLSGDATGNALVDGAKQYLGTPYVWGGTTPDGFDCSGLVQYVYKQNGINIPRTSQEQFKSGVSISRDELQAGDLVFFKGSDGTAEAPGHVAMYIGDGQIIEAPSKGKNVRTIALSEKSGYVGARRYVKSGSGSSSGGSSGTTAASTNSSGTVDKNQNKLDADAYISHWIYSDLGKDWETNSNSKYTDKTTDPLGIVKMKLRKDGYYIKKTLTNAGYSSEKAQSMYDGYVNTLLKKYMAKGKTKKEAEAWYYSNTRY